MDAAAGCTQVRSPSALLRVADLIVSPDAKANPSSRTGNVGSRLRVEKQPSEAKRRSLPRRHSRKPGAKLEAGRDLDRESNLREVPISLALRGSASGMMGVQVISASRVSSESTRHQCGSKSAPSGQTLSL